MFFSLNASKFTMIVAPFLAQRKLAFKAAGFMATNTSAKSPGSLYRDYLRYVPESRKLLQQFLAEREFQLDNQEMSIHRFQIKRQHLRIAGQLIAFRLPNLRRNE